MPLDEKTLAGAVAGGLIGELSVGAGAQYLGHVLEFFG